MSVWLAIALGVIGLVAVAVAVLVTDIARGDVGGAHHTMARARRLLVVATDSRTEKGADRWIGEQRRERPELQCFLLVEPDGQRLFASVEEAIDRERPDAIVMARHDEESHDLLAGTYGRLKEELRVPVDAVFVTKEGDIA